jgi:Na+-transporting methylmalonyl-CoA/oxaloacetate decarboxylase gamma subunit
MQLLASTSVLDALPHLVGMLMVMLTLAILWGVCASVAKLIHVLGPAPVAAAAPVKAAAAPIPATTPRPEAIPPEIVAVIAAAVVTVTGPSRRIISIRSQSTSWEKSGRQSVLTSHRIR